MSCAARRGGGHAGRRHPERCVHRRHGGAARQDAARQGGDRDADLAGGVCQPRRLACCARQLYADRVAEALALAPDLIYVSTYFPEGALVARALAAPPRRPGA